MQYALFPINQRMMFAGTDKRGTRCVARHSHCVELETPLADKVHLSCTLREKVKHLFELRGREYSFMRHFIRFVHVLVCL